MTYTQRPESRKVAPTAKNVIFSGEDGAACARCDACDLRREGFSSAAIPDPTRYQD